MTGKKFQVFIFQRPAQILIVFKPQIGFTNFYGSKKQLTNTMENKFGAGYPPLFQKTDSIENAVRPLEFVVKNWRGAARCGRGKPRQPGRIGRRRRGRRHTPRRAGSWRQMRAGCGPGRQPERRQSRPARGAPNRAGRG